MQETFINHYANHLHSHYKPTRGTYKHLRRYLTGANMDLLKLGMDKVERLNCRYGLSSTSGSFSIGTIMAPINSKSNGSTLFHEIGHALDYIKGSKNSFYTKNHILPCGSTLQTVLKLELKDNLTLLYKFLDAKFNAEIKGIVPDEIIDPLLEISSLHLQAKKLKRSISRGYSNNKLEYDAIVEKMHSIGDYYELWRAFYKHPAYQTFVDNYGVIIDVLNLYYPINVLFAGHSQTYQKRDIGLEFFADVYALHIIHNDKALSHIKELLPKSYQCYMDLMDYHQKHIS